MTPRQSFGRAVLFAAAIALAWFPWALLVVPVAGHGAARGLYLIGAAVAYVALLARASGGGRRPVAAAALLGCVAWGVAGSGADLALVLAAIIGVLRGAVLFGPATTRSVCSESMLLGAGLLLGSFFIGSALPPVAAGLWGFFLVQSLYFLQGASGRGRRGSDGERFDDAYRRAIALLDT